MDLYLVRHATAEDRAETGDDERALTEEGKAKMIRATRGLAKLKVRPDLILASPLRRARETAEILAEGLNRAKVDTLAELALAASPAPWSRRCAPMPDSRAWSWSAISRASAISPPCS